MSDNVFSKDVFDFSFDIRVSKNRIAKQPEIFTRSVKPEEDEDELFILRRWNSHTPMLWDVFGGGYFLRCNGKGIIIDPGCNFVRLFENRTHYGMCNIDMVIVTHDHVDHCQDLSTLISLFRQYNKYLAKKGIAFKTWDILMSLGTENQFNSFLIHKENSPFLRWSAVLADRIVEKIQPPPSISTRSEMLKVKNNLRILKEVWKFRDKKISNEYKFNLRTILAIHDELLGENTAFGISMELKKQRKKTKIVISGDTSFDTKKQETCNKMVKEYESSDILILHVGSMEKTNVNSGGIRRLETDKQHLGFKGVFQILSELNDKPKMVVLTEWGYEFGRIGLRGRTKFSELVVRELRTKGINYYYSLTENNPIGDCPIIPADINLRINLPKLKIYCEKNNAFLEAGHVKAVEKIEYIEYVQR